MNAPVITTEELRGLLRSKENIVLVNVLPENFFKQRRIPGSVNVDGYKMDFIEEVRKAGIKEDAAVVVYASGSDSEASSHAAERMLKHGWINVRDYRDGIAGWAKAGLALEETEGTHANMKTSYVVDAAQSLVLWSGRNMNSIHRGTLNIKEGRIERAGNDSIKGTITIDMTSIANTDLADSAWNKMLVAHLNSTDFFDTAAYPEAKITVKQSKRTTGDGNGVPNFMLTSDLAIKNVTQEIIFPACVGVDEEGVFKAHAHFDFDRTLWNVKYGSAKFFKQLGMHLVDDIISLDLKIIAR
jgi:polyisoprenoid-binding protein YceI